MKSPLNVFDQDMISHKLVVNFHDLCYPSSKPMKPEITKFIIKQATYATMSQIYLIVIQHIIKITFKHANALTKDVFGI